MAACTSARTASARDGSPLACSSITRSSRLLANVTPAALITCRSIGASRCGSAASRRARPVLRAISASAPRRRPFADCTARAGAASSSRSLIGGEALGQIEHAIGAQRHHRRAGVLRRCTQQRPINVPAVPSSGRQRRRSIGRSSEEESAAMRRSRSSDTHYLRGGSRARAKACQQLLQTTPQRGLELARKKPKWPMRLRADVGRRDALHAARGAFS